MYIFGAESHLGAGVVSAFVFPLAAIAQPLTLVFVRVLWHDSILVLLTQNE